MPGPTSGVLVFWVLTWDHRKPGIAQRLRWCSDSEGGSVQPASCPHHCPALLPSLTPRHEDRSQKSLELIHRVCFVPEDLPNLFQMLRDGQRAFAESHRCVFGRVWLKQRCWFCGWCQELYCSPWNQDLATELSSGCFYGAQGLVAWLAGREPLVCVTNNRLGLHRCRLAEQKYPFFQHLKVISILNSRVEWTLLLPIHDKPPIYFLTQGYIFIDF